MKEYNKSNIPLAKELRKNMTPWESKLWYWFLRKYVPRFQRQKAIGNYIVDFYCAKARLAIELDGSGHYAQAQKEKDHYRTEYLNATGLTVLRFSNLDIDRNFRGVCEAIDLVVRQNTSGFRGRCPSAHTGAEGESYAATYVFSPPVSFADSPLVRGG